MRASGFVQAVFNNLAQELGVKPIATVRGVSAYPVGNGYWFTLSMRKPSEPQLVLYTNQRAAVQFVPSDRRLILQAHGRREVTLRLLIKVRGQPSLREDAFMEAARLLARQAKVLASREDIELTHGFGAAT